MEKNVNCKSCNIYLNYTVAGHWPSGLKIVGTQSRGVLNCRASCIKLIKCFISDLACVLVIVQ